MPWSFLQVRHTFVYINDNIVNSAGLIYTIYIMTHQQSPVFSTLVRLPIYTRKVLTVPFTNFLQIRHFLMAGAQSLQQARCPQGRKTMDTFFSIQILHRIWSFRLVFSCFSEVSSVQNQKKILNVAFLHELLATIPLRYFKNASESTF